MSVSNKTCEMCEVGVGITSVHEFCICVILVRELHGQSVLLNFPVLGPADLLHQTNVFDGLKMAAAAAAWIKRAK